VDRDDAVTFAALDGFAVRLHEIVRGGTRRGHAGRRHDVGGDVLVVLEVVGAVEGQVQRNLDDVVAVGDGSGQPC